MYDCRRGPRAAPPVLGWTAPAPCALPVPAFRLWRFAPSVCLAGALGMFGLGTRPLRCIPRAPPRPKRGCGRWPFACHRACLPSTCLPAFVHAATPVMCPVMCPAPARETPTSPAPAGAARRLNLPCPAPARLRPRPAPSCPQHALPLAQHALHSWPEVPRPVPRSVPRLASPAPAAPSPLSPRRPASPAPAAPSPLSPRRPASPAPAAPSPLSPRRLASPAPTAPRLAAQPAGQLRAAQGSGHSRAQHHCLRDQLHRRSRLPYLLIFSLSQP
jgi:hypothetical protein